jgi:hypothetical protein
MSGSATGWAPKRLVADPSADRKHAQEEPEIPKNFGDLVDAERGLTSQRILIDPQISAHAYIRPAAYRAIFKAVLPSRACFIVVFLGAGRRLWQAPGPRIPAFHSIGMIFRVREGCHDDKLDIRAGGSRAVRGGG